MVLLQIVALSLAATLVGQSSDSLGGDVVLLDFYADYCSPCRQMSSTMDELLVKGFPVRKINAEQDRKLAKRFSVTNLPCYILVVNGREVDRVVGMTSFNRLAGMFDQYKDRLRQKSIADLVPQLAKNIPSLPSAPGAMLPAIGSRPLTPIRLVSQEQPVVSNSTRESAFIPSIQQNGSSASPITNAQMLSCTARLRIQDPDGHSFGTGTVVDSRNGCALILTCGHIFRDSKGRGLIEVELFGTAGREKLEGELVAYDLDRDLGLIRIRPNSPIAVARIAPKNYRVVEGMAVASSGCDQGADPTVVHTKVISLNKFLGPPNLQTSGKPVEGRSGGGLFTPEGYLVGVCNAADPADNEGFFAALGSIHDELDRRGMDYVYNVPQGPWIARINEPLGDHSLDLATSDMPRNMPPRPTLEPITDMSLQPTAARTVEPQASPAPGLPSRLSPEEQAALEEIQRRRASGTEVICIFRDCSNPQAKSEVVILGKASANFLRRLADQTETSPTSSR
jgi:thiol-disulfide isomerase/thioredoxin